MINTEQAQYAINAAIHSIREACAGLLDKRKELEFKGEMKPVLIRLIPLITFLDSKESKIARDFLFRAANLRILSQIHGKLSYPTCSRVLTG